MRYVVYPETSIASIPKDAEAVHLARPLGAGKIGKLLKGRAICEVSLSKSCRGRLTEKAVKLIESSGASIVEESVRGRPLETGMEKMAEIVEMHRMDKPYREIEKRLGVPKSTAHYLIKYAERQKAKEGRRTVCLK